MRRIAKIAAVIALALITAFNICTMLVRSIDLKDRLNWLPAALLEVESGSMEPRLSKGDLIVVWETPYEELAAGDIITFHSGNEFVTHELRRWDGSRLVTRGLANDLDDASIGPEEYCARMLFAIPGGGVVLEALTAPVSLVLSVVLILFLFYGMPLMKSLWDRLEKKPADIKRPGVVRIAASAAAVSVLVVTPFMTAAKYTAKMDAYATSIAQAKYFSSNYISEEGTSYNISGWNGENYQINLQIRNYDNDLLFNGVGHDLKYCIRLVPVTEEGYKTDYTLSITTPAGIQTGGSIEDFTFSDSWPESELSYGPFLLTGDDTGGKSSNFSVKIAAAQDENGDYVLNGGDRIRFKIYAGTETDKEYFQQMTGDFTLQVASSDSFLGEQKLDTAVGTSLVTYSLKTTNNSEGKSTHNVTVSWDRSKMYINEYEATVQNLKQSHPGNLVLDDGSGRGNIILPLQAYSSISLQFFKYNSNTPVYFEAYNDEDGHGHVADIYALDEDNLPPAPPEDITPPGPGEDDDPTEDPGTPDPGENPGDPTE